MMMCISIIVFNICINMIMSVPSDFILDIDGSSIIAGQNHACVIESKHGIEFGGKVTCWDDDDEEKPPKDVIFIQIAGGMFFSCGVAVDETLHCWGHTKQKSVPGLYRQITVSKTYGCGILTDGRIKCFGSSPVMKLIPEKDSIKYVQISCSQLHCCAIDENAFPHCWGTDSTGETKCPAAELSLDKQEFINRHNNIDEDEDRFQDEEEDSAESEDKSTTENELKKTQIKQISAGPHYSCGITISSESIICWGEHKSVKSFPRYLPGPYKQVSLGHNGICAIRADTEVNENTLEAHIENTQALDLSRSDKIIKLIGYLPNSIECWGNAKTLIPTSSLSSEWDQISIGDGVICGVTMDSEFKCWGRSRVHQIPSDVVVA